MNREQQLEKDIVLMYWRVASLPASNATQQLWSTIKRIVSERNIDIEQEFQLDGLAGAIKTKLDEKQTKTMEE